MFTNVRMSLFTFWTGKLKVTLGDQKMKAVSGVMALLTRGIPHGFTNIGSKPSRLLDTILPGLFDNYFVELAALFAAGDPSEEQIDDSAPLSAKLLKNSTLKTYKGFPHGMPTTEADTINADLLTFLNPPSIIKLAPVM